MNLICILHIPALNTVNRSFNLILAQIIDDALWAVVQLKSTNIAYLKLDSRHATYSETPPPVRPLRSAREADSRNRPVLNLV